MSTGAVCGQAYKLTQHKDSTGHKHCWEEKAKEQEDKKVKKKKNISKEAMVASSVAQKWTMMYIVLELSFCYVYI